MTQEELYEIIAINENFRIELTTSIGDMDKFQEAICAFANDMPGSRKKGYLLIGVRNNGEIDGLKVDDALMKKISGIRSDGNILPLPVMSTEKVGTEKGDVLVVEVTPSFDTPVRYRGRTFIRIGPLRELMMNAVMHRDYQANMPTRLYRYDNHIEIMNPGGLYGQARPENFPHVNDYRNSVVAGMMKTLNYVNMFNHGIGEVQDLLRANENPEAMFNVSYLTAFSVVVKDPGDVSLPIAVHQLVPILSQQVKSLIVSLKNDKKAATELQLVTNLSPKSRRAFRDLYLAPSIKDGLVAMTHPENPRHPQQKYYLTELGLAVLEMLTKQETESTTQNE